MNKVAEGGEGVISGRGRKEAGRLQPERPQSHRQKHRTHREHEGERGRGGGLLTCSLSLRRLLFSHEYENISISHRLQDRMIKEFHLVCPFEAS